MNTVVASGSLFNQQVLDNLEQYTHVAGSNHNDHQMYILFFLLVQFYQDVFFSKYVICIFFFSHFQYIRIICHAT